MQSPLGRLVSRVRWACEDPGLSFGVRPEPSSERARMGAGSARGAVASAAVAVCTAAACSVGGGPPRDGSPVQTDAVVYRLRRTAGAREATAVATYVNRTGAPVYYKRCGAGEHDGPIFWYRGTGRDSARPLFTNIAWGCPDGAPLGEIRPGDSVVVRVPLGALDQPNMTPPLRLEEIVGLMRIELELCAPAAGSGDCKPLPLAARQSNALDVRL